VKTKRFIDVPVTPTMIPCKCEIDPTLRAFGAGDPIADAQSAYDAGRPVFFGLPKLGTVVPGFSMDLSQIESFPDTPTRQIPGTDEGSNCYERERLELRAESYAVKYNTRLLELILYEL